MKSNVFEVIWDLKQYSSGTALILFEVICLIAVFSYMNHIKLNLNFRNSVFWYHEYLPGVWGVTDILSVFSFTVYVWLSDVLIRNTFK